MNLPTQTSLITPPTTAPVDARQAYLDLARQAVSRQALGQRLSREEIKAIREAALLQATDTHWSDRAACAADMGLAAKKIEALAAAGCPLPPHAPIPMVPVFRWLRLHESTTPTPTDPLEAARSLGDAQSAEDLRFRRLKNDRIEGRLIAEAESAALTALAEMVRTLRSELLHALPDRAADALAECNDRKARLRCLRDQIQTALADCARRAGVGAEETT
jgi:hypothetical protein